MVSVAEGSLPFIEKPKLEYVYATVIYKEF